MRSRTPFAALVVLLLFAAAFAAAEDSHSLRGVVRDGQGAVVPGARIALWTSSRALLQTVAADAQGRFHLTGIPRGSYLFSVEARGFDEHRLAVQVPLEGKSELDITLTLAPIREQVTVTANPGSIEAAQSISQAVNVIDRQEIARRVTTVVAQVAEEEPGLSVQRTSATMGGIFIRGLTGAKVNTFIDGVRYSTAAARGGVSTFFNLVEPTSLDSVEVLRGPSGAQYGSDAIGGSIQFLTPTAALSPQGNVVHGSYGTSFASADVSYGTHASLSLGTKKIGLYTNLASRRINTLRTGQALDSHAAVTRFLGLSSSVFGNDRLPDTAFTQYGGVVKLNWAPHANTSIVTSYSRGQQDGGKRYDQLLGGDGNLIADLRSLMDDFFYVRLDQVRLPGLSTLTAVYSYNAQREERVNQGGNGNPNAAINHEYEKNRANGMQLYGTRQWNRNLFVAGLEYYHERLTAPSFGFNPATQASTLRRGRVPDQALYQSGGIYAQDAVDLFARRLRLVGNVRYSAASYRQRAVDSPLVNNAPLWPDDSLRASSWSYRAGAICTPHNLVSLAANFGRGFRAPSMTDLATLGLTGAGFEVAFPDVAGLGATVGNGAGSTAVSTGLPVVQMKSESSQSYEVSARLRTKHFETDFTVFVNDIHGEIVRQALILQQSAVGTTIGGEPIISQNANGVVFVALSGSPVLIRTNFSDSRFKGFEHDMEWRFAQHWSVRTAYTFLRANDQETGMPPNIEASLPASNGFLVLRYAPPSGWWWVEPYLHFAERLDRISSLALEDRRTGATRTRSSIQNFFRNGATVRGLIGPGPNGTFGNADDILLATGETLVQVQDRVLGVGVNSAPLFTALAGYATFNLRGGFRVRERHEILWDFSNIGDRNYRGVSWGLDAAGRAFALRYLARF